MSSADKTRDNSKSPARKPRFLITIDTEGDSLWSLPSTITTRNAAYLPRFQQLCEKYDLKPTWLTNWEMANSGPFQEFALDVLSRGKGEIGMHLHAWNTPPLSAQERRDVRHQHCLIALPRQQMRDKVARITDLLEDTFSVKMVSHRAGRWAMNSEYAKALIDFGYLVDCSVTPHIRWNYRFAGSAETVCDYRGFPDHAYWLDPDDLGHEGHSPLLEVPMTIFPGVNHRLAKSTRSTGSRFAITRRIANRLFPEVHWFRPFRGNASTLPRIPDWAEAQRRDHVEFMIHSSELMPGGSPSFRTSASIERLYARLESLFDQMRGRFVGRTLAEYRAEFTGRLADSNAQREQVKRVTDGKLSDGITH